MGKLKIYHGVKKIIAGALVGITLATPVASKADSNNSTSVTTTITTVATTESSLKQQLLDRRIAFNPEDVLAYRFLANIESIAAYVESKGSLPAAYAELDLESLDFEQLYNKANRINDAIGNTLLDPENKVDADGKYLSQTYVDPSLAVDNISPAHEHIIKRSSYCVSAVARATLDSWLDPESSLLDNANACTAINEFMQLVRQARTSLTAGEYEMIFLGNVQNMGGYILMDGGLANEYMESLKALGTACDFNVIYEPDGQSMISVNPARIAELTNSIREKLGYEQSVCKK